MLGGDHDDDNQLSLPLEMLRFTLQHGQTADLIPRLGQISRPGRVLMSTPHYVATTSRGVVPHLSHDMMRKHTSISGVYIALEDFVEKAPENAPIFKNPASPDESRLRRYLALQDDCWSMLGPRRIPAISCPAQNTSSAISICTSVGFRSLDVKEYEIAIASLQPDIAFQPADIIGSDKPSRKRIEKSADRTHAWLRESIDARHQNTLTSALLAAVLPIDKEQQSLYLSDLDDEFHSSINGLYISNIVSSPPIPASLSSLLLFGLINPTTPHEILLAISHGLDIFTLPFVTSSSEHGLALSFKFTSPDSSHDGTNSPASPLRLQNGALPLAADLWSSSPDFATSLAPLSPNCTCYTCTRHHTAYVSHLLRAKEMLAWTLLQIHNFAVIDSFFSDVRQSIARGTFSRDVETFGLKYERELPEMSEAAPNGTAAEIERERGPRIRGYQMKSVGGVEPRKNRRVWGRLDDVHAEARATAGLDLGNDHRPDSPGDEMATGLHQDEGQDVGENDDHRVLVRGEPGA